MRFQIKQKPWYFRIMEPFKYNTTYFKDGIIYYPKGRKPSVMLVKTLLNKAIKNK